MCPKLAGSQRKEGREIRHPGLLCVFTLLPPLLPEAGGLHGVLRASSANQVYVSARRALGFASPGGGVFASPPPAPMGHPLGSICAGLLFAYASAGQVTC